MAHDKSNNCNGIDSWLTGSKDHVYSRSHNVCFQLFDRKVLFEKIFEVKSVSGLKMYHARYHVVEPDE